AAVGVGVRALIEAGIDVDRRARSAGNIASGVRRIARAQRLGPVTAVDDRRLFAGDVECASSHDDPSEIRKRCIRVSRRRSNRHASGTLPTGIADLSTRAGAWRYSEASKPIRRCPMAARSIASLSLTFVLVSIPVNDYS